MEINEKKSKAQKRKMLFKKYRKLMGSYLDTANFKEPILILMRVSNKAEFYENATQGEFRFTHSDGNERNIVLNTKFLQTFDYGKKTFKGYICHENYFSPLPEEPVVTNEMIGIAIDKTLNDLKKWKAEEYRAKGKMWYYIFGGIALVILAYTFYVMLKQPVEPATIIQAGQQTGQGVIQLVNGTIYT